MINFKRCYQLTDQSDYIDKRQLLIHILIVTFNTLFQNYRISRFIFFKKNPTKLMSENESLLMIYHICYKDNIISPTDFCFIINPIKFSSMFFKQAENAMLVMNSLMHAIQYLFYAATILIHIPRITRNFFQHPSMYTMRSAMLYCWKISYFVILCNP